MLLNSDCLPKAVGKQPPDVHTLDLSWRKVNVKLMMMMMKCWQAPEITSFLCSTVLYYVVLCLSTAVLWDSIYSLHGFYSKYVS